LSLSDDTVTAKDLIEEAGRKLYKRPLSLVRVEAGFPDLNNPLHLIVLLVDCDTEIMMNGMLGFLENPTGRHLTATIEALRQIGAPIVAGQFQRVHDCMKRHGVTWERLREDFGSGQENQITSFRKLHGNQLDAFAAEVSTLGRDFSLFHPQSGESPFQALCAYLDGRVAELRKEIDRREATPNAGLNDAS
jgi:hypothetical protein